MFSGQGRSPLWETSVGTAAGMQRWSRANVPVHFHRFPAAVPSGLVMSSTEHNSIHGWEVDDAHSEGLNWGGVNLRHFLPPGEAHGCQVKRSSWGFGASWKAAHCVWQVASGAGSDNESCLIAVGRIYSLLLVFEVIMFHFYKGLEMRTTVMYHYLTLQ